MESRETNVSLPCLRSHICLSFSLALLWSTATGHRLKLAREVCGGQAGRVWGEAAGGGGEVALAIDREGRGSEVK
jgi:hypothetical protein